MDFMHGNHESWPRVNSNGSDIRASPCETFAEEHQEDDPATSFRAPSPLHGSGHVAQEAPLKEHLSYPTPTPMRAMRAAVWRRDVARNAASTPNVVVSPGVIRVDGPGLSQSPPSRTPDATDPLEAEVVQDIIPLEVRNVSEETSRRSVRKRNLPCTLLTLLVSLVAAAAFALMFTVGKSVIGNKRSKPTPPELDLSKRPTRTPSVAPSTLEPTSSSQPSTVREAAWVSAIQSRSPSTTFDDDASPQRLALDWMLEDTYSLSLKNDNRIVQRFALTVMFFAMRTPTRWLNSTNECEWRGVAYDLECRRGYVEKMHLSGDGLFGSIPIEIALLTTAQHLDFFNNELRGTIPTEIGLLSSLTYLSLSNNKLGGSIPSEIGLLTSLVRLSLYRNNLNGTVPTEFGLLQALEACSAFANDIRGQIPAELELLTSLTEIHLWGNSLSGTIPTGVWQLSALKLLGFYNNSLSGTIPTEVGLLSSGSGLSLAANDFHGTIPTEIGLLSSTITRLSLGANLKISGRVPSQLAGLTRLKELDLYDTQLSGSIPSTLCSQLRRADIDCGEIDCDCCTAYPSGWSC